AAHVRQHLRRAVPRHPRRPRGSPRRSQHPAGRPQAPQRQERRLMPARLRRSVLAVPGSNPRMMEKAASSSADEVFLDLEDACAPLEKPGARAKVIEALRTHDWSGKTRVVRINQVTSPWAMDDLRDIVIEAGDRLDCIMVPKVRNAGDVPFVDRA